MSPEQERAAIVKFLRERTRLYPLADLIESGGHWYSPDTLTAWAKGRNVTLLEKKK